MARVDDLKMAALAAMILLALALCGRGDVQLGQVDPTLSPVPEVETQILAADVTPYTA